MQGKKNQYKAISDVPSDVWKKLANKKIYFGHQSVGYDILQGVEELVEEYDFITLDISENINSAGSKSGVLIHSKVGKNVDPISKTKNFHTILSSGLGKDVDIAGFKFCYVDINRPDNNTVIMNDYVSSIQAIEKEFSDLTVVHFTVPLMAIDTSWKNKIKKILGRKVNDRSSENVARNEYNTLLRKQLGDNALLFDIATIESTFPDGMRATFVHDGKSYFCMVPEYTYDGGHLSPLGRRKLGEQFLLFLAAID